MSTLAPPEPLRFESSGMSFGALAWGPADGPLALCLHGYPDTAWTWRHLGPSLGERGWRVVAPFLRGYAPSDLAPDGCYQIGALVRDAVGAHAALGGDERAVLIGHDWGATAAYAAGAFAPERFRRIVTIAIPPPATLAAAPGSLGELIGDRKLILRQLRYSWYMLYQQLPIVSERSLHRLIPWLWSEWSPGFDASEELAHVWDALDSPARLTAALRYYRALAQPWYRSTEYETEQRCVYRRSERPVLYLHGREDGCMQSAFADRAGEALPAGSEIAVIDRAGHFAHLERPDLILRKVAAFIGE